MRNENTQLTLGSLFDGIGGFPLAGMQAGIRPVWASEIEPFPIRVVEKRLPHLRHYGDVHRLQIAAVQFADIAVMLHIGQSLLRHAHGKRLDLRRPDGMNTRLDACQRKTADTVKKTAQCQLVQGALPPFGFRRFRELLSSAGGVSSCSGVFPSAC